MEMKESVEELAYFHKINKMNKLLGSPVLDLTQNNSWDGDHFTEICSIFEGAGWEVYKSTTACSKAIKEINYFESNRSEVRVNIVVCNFMGLFTQISLSNYRN